MMSKEYQEFISFIEEDMIKMWIKVKLTYIISVYNINLIMSKDSTVTIERIMNDLQKNPFVKEVFMSLEQIIIVPK